MKLKEKIRQVFEELEAQTADGCVTPEMLVDASRSEDSLLHKHFEWDDQVAGERYRIWQARVLLNKMTVEVDDKETREYENLVVKVNDHKTQGYFHIDRIMENKKLKSAVVDQVQKELKSMLDKYERYERIYTALSKARIEIERQAQYVTE